MKIATLTRNVNYKSCIHWAEENLHMLLYDRYVVNCVAVCRARINGVAGLFNLGPYFFEGVTSSDMQMCSITGAWSKAMLENITTEL